MTYQQWALMHPVAAADLERMFAEVRAVPLDPRVKGEAAVQQQVRLSVSRQGGYAWRNNVGATPAKTKHTCPRCAMRFEEKQQPIRYGLANDSQKLNQRVKSSDLILAIPRVIRPEDVGTTIAQFGAVETKKPGWTYTGTRQEPAQAAWLALIKRIGGFATFCSGDLEL